MKLATWNVNSLNVRLPHLLTWLRDNPVDALVIQETKLTDDKFPRTEIEAAGYKAAFHGQKTYNGVALLSKSDASAVVKNIPGFNDDQARVITGTLAGLRVVGAYFPNGQAPGTEKTRCSGCGRCATGCAKSWPSTRD
jgi:exodeoxyribonuclease III